jgi:hypothetical protein
MHFMAAVRGWNLWEHGKHENHDLHLLDAWSQCWALQLIASRHAAGGVQVVELLHVAPLWGKGADDIVVFQIPASKASLSS